MRRAGTGPDGRGSGERMLLTWSGMRSSAIETGGRSRRFGPEKCAVMNMVLVIAVFWLAYANGANDNFKGVATLYGSATTDFRRALRLATVATLAGSLVSLLLASSLAASFSGRGLVPSSLVGQSSLLIATGSAAAITILLATRLGMPTSTTHALTGALVGISLVMGGGAAPVGKLWNGFLLPLLVSPILAILGAGAVYPLMRAARLRLGVSRESCVCIAAEPAVALAEVSGTVRLADARHGEPMRLIVAPSERCAARYEGRIVGIGAQAVVNGVHHLSAAAVCFARAVNDTPKIAALLLAAGVTGCMAWELLLAAGAMALGGLLNSRRVAETMSKRITELNTGQGLTGNLVTAALVLGASRFGLPVSTTHVSCGSLFGIGIVTGAARWRTIGSILLAWMTTLPCAAALGAGLFWLATQLEG